MAALDGEAAPLVARLSELEEHKARDAAEQARISVRLDEVRRAIEERDDVPARRRGVGVPLEFLRARQDSTARATILVRETAYLTREDGQKIDVDMCADPGRLHGTGGHRLAAEAKKLAYRFDPQAVVRRTRRAESDRRVTICPAPGAMTYLAAPLLVA